MNPEKQNPYSSHATTDLSGWWIAKVVCGLILVSNQILAISSAPITASIAAPLPLSQLLVLTGGAVFFVHLFLLKRENHRLNAPDHLLTASGFFPYIRHPMYLGEMILDTGLASFALNPVSLTVLAIALISLYKQAVHEDHFLRRHFQQDFRAWENHTWLILPHVR